MTNQQEPFIPIIDFSPFFSSDAEKKNALVGQINKACRDIGFFYIKNHGVSQDLIDECFIQSKQFFNLPEKEKLQMHVKYSPAQRGYFPPMEENTNAASYDLKEGYDMSRDLDDTHPNVKKGLIFYGANVYPESLPHFKSTVDSYYNEMWRLAGQILSVFALALELPDNYFDHMVDNPMAQLRLLHYPPHRINENSNILSCGEHTDYGCVTILYTDNVSGLQIKDGNGEWHSAPSIPGAFIINIGEIMERWTNGLYKATEHRVLDNGGKDRYSIPFFFDPNHDAIIECIPTCMSADHPPKYAPIKAADYLNTRFDYSFSYRKETTTEKNLLSS